MQKSCSSITWASKLHDLCEAPNNHPGCRWGWPVPSTIASQGLGHVWQEAEADSRISMGGVIYTVAYIYMYIYIYIEIYISDVTPPPVVYLFSGGG